MGDEAKKNRWAVPPGMKFKLPSDLAKLFKPKPKTLKGCLHVNSTEEPPSSEGDRIIVFINEPLTEEEKSIFSNLLRANHREWFGCACWRENGLAVRISIKTNNHLNDARMDIAKHIDAVLGEIFTNRTAKKK